MAMPAYLPCIDENNNSGSNKDSLITSYFGQGYSNREIISFLAIQHSIYISLSTLKRTLSRLGLLRRHPRGTEDREEIIGIISEELCSSGSTLGK
jgi:hypothetical protein